MSEMQQQAPLESLEGKQIGLQEYVEYKKNFNEERTLTFSSSDLYRQRKLEQDREITANLFWGASTLGLGALLVQAGNSNDSIRALLEAMPMARLARQKAVRQALDNKAAGVILESVHGTHAFGRQTVQQSLHSMLMGVEELSPLQLLKTLQLSSFSSLFAQTAAEATEALHLREASIRAHADYYFQLIKAEGNKQLNQQNIEDGFILKNNKLYQAVRQLDGSYKEGDVLLNSARMIHAGTVTGTDAVSTNRVFEKFSNMYGVGINRQAIQVEPMVIVGARSNERLAQSWFRSYGRFALELGAKSLDNPLGFIEEYLSLTDTSRKVFSTKAWQLAKKYTNIQLGSGGIYNISSREMMLRTGKNLAVKGAIAAVGYQAADSIVQFLAPEGSAWDNGIVAGLAAATMRAHVGFAEMWSDNFQDIKKTQENAAPGSTSLITLAGLPLAGAMLGANLTYFQRMGDSLIKGVDAASVKHVAERTVKGVAGSILKAGGITLEGNTLARRAKLGALGGAVLALPFLPGALVGKSSEELKKEYSGETKVAVRKTRYWLAGGENFEGGQVKYHRDHLLRVLATDARTKTLYGDRATARDLNPIFSPFKYLKNPYAFEEMHTHDAPMPVWGMDTSYGSFLGQLFKGTVGQIIKPSVIHPEIYKVHEGGIDYSDNHLKKRGINYLTTKLQDLAEEQARPPVTVPTSSLPHLQPHYQSIDEMGDRDMVQTVESDFDSDGKYIGDGTVREPIVDPTRLRLDEDAFTTPLHEKKDVKSLIDDGWMLRANAPTNEPYTRASQSTWSALEEFVGLKGFVGGLALEAVTGAAPTDQLRPELEVSGSMTNMSNTIMDMQLGDALGCFTPETLVHTSKGYVQIQHMSTKHKVLSLNYKYQKVLEIHKKHFSDIPLCYVSVQGMCKFIRCTPDHKFPSIKPHDMQIVDRPMGDLSEGDYILMIDHKYLNATCRMIAQLRGKRSPIYRAVKIVSKVTGRYTGYMYDLSINRTPYYTVYDCICHNSGEFLRRLFPQSASSKREAVNPMRNLVAPSWLPQNTTKYHVDFAQGAYFKNEMGEVLNPGTKGFEELNPHLKGVNPEDYPLVYQYQVLQNIARYSPEHIAVKEYLVRNLESLSDIEKDVFFEAYAQDTLRDQYKKFSEYATEEEKSKMGLFAMHNALWETIAHKENPLEPLLPFRPMAKFVHQRTAIEDYRKAVVYGPDTGIWTNPKSHFIDPAIHRTVGMFDDHLPDDYEEKARVDALFDNLALLKAGKNGKDYDFDRNITALSYSGVMDAEAMHRFRMALPEEQRPYVEAFSREKDADKRAEILSMVPASVGAVYQSIWQNIDVYDKAVHEGKDPIKALEKEYLKDTKTLARKVEVEDKFSFNLFGNIEMEEAREIRKKAAIKHAENHVKSVLGSIPSDRWIGWDPRLKMDDIKLKTLMVGREDLHKYGFWDKDRERVERLVVLDQEAEVITDLDRIKEGSKALDRKEMALRQRLRAAGFETYRITNTKSPRSDKIVIKDTEAYLNSYYGGGASTGETE